MLDQPEYVEYAFNAVRLIKRQFVKKSLCRTAKYTL